MSNVNEEDYRKYLYWNIADFNNDFELFNQIVQANVSEEIAEILKEEDVSEIFKNDEYQDMATQVAINIISSKYREILYSRSLKTMEGYLLPGVDLLTGGKERFGQTPKLSGMKLPFLTSDGSGQPILLSLNKFSKSDNIHFTKTEDHPEDVKIPIPYFYRVRVRVTEQDGENKIQGFERTIQSIDIIDNTSLLNLSQIKEIFENTAKGIEEVSKYDKNNFILLKGLRWKYTNPVEAWILSETETIEKEKYDPVTNQPMTMIDPITQQLKKVTYSVPKPIRLEKGQPFIQTKLGFEEGNMLYVLNVSLNPEDKESKYLPSVSIVNHRYGSPQFWIYSKEAVMNNALTFGEFSSENKNENPFSVINSAYIGTEVYVLGVLTDFYEKESKFITNINGSVLAAKDFDLFHKRDASLPFSLDQLTDMELSPYLEQIEPFNFVEADDPNQLPPVVEIIEKEPVDEKKWSPEFLGFINNINNLFDEPIEYDNISNEIVETLLNNGFVVINSNKLEMIKKISPYEELETIFQTMLSAKLKEKELEDDFEDEEVDESGEDQLEEPTETEQENIEEESEPEPEPEKPKPKAKKKASKKAKKKNMFEDDSKPTISKQQEQLKKSAPNTHKLDSLTPQEKKEYEELYSVLEELLQDETFSDVTFDDLKDVGILPSWVNDTFANTVNGIIKEIKDNAES